jgi:hypothetical protein
MLQLKVICVTEEYIESLKQRSHDLRLKRKLDPTGEAMANEIDELCNEILRLREVLRQAVSYVNERNPDKAKRLEASMETDASMPG